MVDGVRGEREVVDRSFVGEEGTLHFGGFILSVEMLLSLRYRTRYLLLFLRTPKSRKTETPGDISLNL
jgi:hypothetical protein